MSRHLLTVIPGAHLLSDALISSPILSADRSASIPEELGGTGAAPAAGGSSAANDFEFGVDPSLDPELAMALRMSMQEAQAREAAEASSAPASGSNAAPSATVASAVSTIPADPTDDEEEMMLQQALAMSKGENTDDAEADDDEDEDGDVEMDDEEEDDDEEEEGEGEGEGEGEEYEDEDEEIQRAIQASMQPQDESKGSKK